MKEIFRDMEMQELRHGKPINIERYGYPETKLNNKPAPYYESEYLLVYCAHSNIPSVAKFSYGTSKNGYDWQEWGNDDCLYLNITHWCEIPTL
jgi:hypothetical protein